MEKLTLGVQLFKKRFGLYMPKYAYIYIYIYIYIICELGLSRRMPLNIISEFKIDGTFINHSNRGK